MQRDVELLECPACKALWDMPCPACIAEREANERAILAAAGVGGQSSPLRQENAITDWPESNGMIASAVSSGRRVFKKPIGDGD